MIAIAVVSIATGDIDSINYGADYKGNRCGRGDYANRTKTFYPRIDRDIYEQRELIVQQKPWLVQLYGLCTEECIDPDSVDVAGGIVAPVVRENYHWDEDTSTAKLDRKRYWVTVLPEVTLLNRCLPFSLVDEKSTRYCYFPTCTTLGVACESDDAGDPNSWLLSKNPDIADQCEVTKTVGASSEFNNYHQSFMQDYIAGQLGTFIAFIESLEESRVEIAVSSLAIAAAASFVWLVSMRYVAGFVIYFMLLLMFLTLLFVTSVTFAYSCFIDSSVYDCSAAASESYSYSGVSLENLTVHRIGFFVCLLCLLIYTASIAFLRKAIRTCIAIVREASVVVGQLPTLFGLPVGASLLSVGLFLYFLYIGAYIATSSDQAYTYFDTEDTAAIAAKLSDNSQRTLYFLASYHLLGTLWGLSFVVGFVTLTIAGAVSSWFFFRDDPESYPTAPVVTSLHTTVRFHLGTIAFGSLLIAICQCLRIALEFLDRQTQGLQDSNIVAKLVLKCVKCYMWCLEKFLKFITGYAYIYTAIEGMSFMGAARATFVLIMKYPAQVYINHLVQFVLKLLMSITIPFLCGLVCFFWVDRGGKPDPMYCAVVTVVMAFFISRLFAVVFETVIESIFVCAFRDRDLYEARHTPASIRVALGFDAKVQDEEKKPLKGSGKVAEVASEA